MTDKSVIEWLRYQAGELRVWQAKGALDVLERQLPAQPKPPAWVVTWTEVRHGGVIDGTSTLTSWQAALDYIERIVPCGATFTVKAA